MHKELVPVFLLKQHYGAGEYKREYLLGLIYIYTHIIPYLPKTIEDGIFMGKELFTGGLKGVMTGKVGIKGKAKLGLMLFIKFIKLYDAGVHELSFVHDTP